MQRIYLLFANSTKRWKVLLDNVPDLTMKSLYNTRWESRIKSVQAIRFQPSQIRLALLQLYMLHYYIVRFILYFPRIVICIFLGLYSLAYIRPPLVLVIYNL